MTTFMQFEGPTFTLQVPTNWLITSSPKLQAIFVEPVRESQHQPASLLISMRKLKEDATLTEIVLETKKSQQREFPQYKELSEETVTRDKINGISITYQWYNAKTSSKIYQQQVFFLVSQILYTLTASNPNTETADEVENILKRMIDSFQITQS